MLKNPFSTFVVGASYYLVNARHCGWSTNLAVSLYSCLYVSCRCTYICYKSYSFVSGMFTSSPAGDCAPRLASPTSHAANDPGRLPVIGVATGASPSPEGRSPHGGGLVSNTMTKTKNFFTRKNHDGHQRGSNFEKSLSIFNCLLYCCLKSMLHNKQQKQLKKTLAKKFVCRFLL